MKNPRGASRPQDGRGKGAGVPGGQRSGRNTGPGKADGPGYGQGGGRGKGTNRGK